MLFRRFAAGLVACFVFLSVAGPAARAENAINIPDAAFRACINEELGQPVAAPPTSSQLESITRLDCSLAAGEQPITDLTGAQHLTGMTRLFLSDHDVVDLAPLSTLTGLQMLELFQIDKVRSTAPLRGLTGLTSLGMHDSQLPDLEFVRALPALSRVYVLAADLDLSPLGEVKTLTELSLSGSSRSDYSFIGGLPELRTLSLSAPEGRRIDSIGAPPELATARFSVRSMMELGFLTGLARLRELELSAPKVSDLRGLSTLTDLRRLTIRSMAATDLNALKTLTALTDLGVANNALTNVSGIAGLPALVSVDLRNNRLTSLPSLKALTTLTTLNVSENKLASLGGALPEQLTTLDAGDNALTTVDDLNAVTGLTQAKVSRNRLATLTLSGLKSLRTLSASHNALSAPRLTDLPNLAELDLNHNVLAELPEWEGLPALKSLGVAGNRISDVSEVPDRIKLNAMDQQVTASVVGTVGVPGPVPLGGLGGRPPTVVPDAGATFADGRLTFSKPGTHWMTFDQSRGDSRFAGSLTQKAGPDAEWIKTYPADLGNTTAHVNVDLVASMKPWVPTPYQVEYQWYRDGKKVPGATNSAYSMTAADLGHRLKASLTVSLDGYRTRTVWTQESAKVAKGGFRGEDVTIHGTARTGERLSLKLHWEPTPQNCSYRWRRNEHPISKATKSSYTLTAADLGKRIDVVATCDAPGIYRDSTISKRTAKVAQGPVRSSEPTIKGTVAVGKKLTVNRGSWGPGTIGFRYRWLRDGKAIAKATGSSYTVKAADRGHQLAVRITGDRSSYTAVTRTSRSPQVA